MRFVRAIGLAVELGPLDAPGVLPGIALTASGGLRIDEAALAYPGDILHEAGHLAVLAPAARATGGALVETAESAGDEMAAIAWSYAAALHLGIDPAVVFHPAGYRGGSAAILENFACGRTFGVPLLAWYGMTREQPRRGPSDPGAYPVMRAWLRG
ncbi:MAG: hypothetical protein U1F43_18920 [Myxococcota bacterium]